MPANLGETRKPRDTLKGYFVRNAVPTQAQFQQLIDSGLNQPDDGIFRLPGDPLSIAADGEAAGLGKALGFYRAMADASAAWTIALRPRDAPDQPDTTTDGFAILDAGDNCRLSIDAETGNVGINTVAAREALEVAGRVRAGALVIGAWPANYSYATIGSAYLNQKDPANYALGVGVNAEAGVTFLNSPTRVVARVANADKLDVTAQGIGISSPLRISSSEIYFTGAGHKHTGIGNAAGSAAIENDGGEYNALMLLGRNVLSGGAVRRVVKLWDELTVNGRLSVTGALTPSAGQGEQGIVFPGDPGGGAGDRAAIQYFARSGEATTLMLSTSNDAQDHISLMPSGNVGVKTLEPTRGALHVQGDLFVTGRIGSMNRGPEPATPGWSGGLRTYDLEADGSIRCWNSITPNWRDVAEVYYSAEPLEPGDVVRLGDVRDAIVAATEAADRRMLGVVSEKPGVLLGGLVADPGGRPGHPVALIGCVPCKVSDEAGPIAPGDLLTSASARGRAMRAGDDALPGTILGKAMEPHAAGEGMIDVFVMLR